MPMSSSSVGTIMWVAGLVLVQLAVGWRFGGWVLSTALIGATLVLVGAVFDLFGKT